MLPTTWQVLNDDNTITPGRTVTLYSIDYTTGNVFIINEHGRAVLMPFLLFSANHVHAEYRRPIL